VANQLFHLFVRSSRDLWKGRMKTISQTFFLFSLFTQLISALKCRITNETNIVYSTVNGVGPASQIWVEDFLWWWKSTDPSINYLGLTANDFQVCNFASFPNLRVYINPGGNTYDQLTAIGPIGTENIKSFIQRDQKNPSGYAGFCAGGYLASHDYLWETLYEGPGYFNYEESPPLSIFPHMVEGSIVEINDEQFGDQYGSKFRLVNVSNGHLMLYYGGSTFGWNGALDPTDPQSGIYDPDVEVLIYYTDFYGYHSYNIPAAWKYHNILLTSVHPEADNCTYYENYDCPPAGTIPYVNILQNRAWLCTYINQVSQSSFVIPEVPLKPLFDTSKPHVGYPKESCYDNGITSASSGSQILFCDDFDSNEDEIPTGLSSQFQRNQSDFNVVRPWNTSYTDVWNNGIKYTSPETGDGYAVCVPMAPVSRVASITTRPFDISKCRDEKFFVEFATTGNSISSGYISVEVGSGVDSQMYSNWVTLSKFSYDNNESQEWEKMVLTVNKNELPPSMESTAFVRFTCAAGNAIENFCALDSLFVSC
jgi:glutamine amidotransferase-like uncharacterized protein